MTQWSFVRIGASRRCEKCGTRFVIDRAHVTRQSRAAGGTQALLPSAGDIEKVPPRVDEHGNVIGLSGLTEMMQRETRPRSGGAGDRPPEAATVRRSSVAAVRTEQRRHDVRWLYILLGVMVAIMVLLGFSIWFATNIGTGGSARYTEPTHRPEPTVPPRDVEPARPPALPAAPLNAEPWREQRSMFMLPVRPAAHARALRLTPRPDGGVTLVGEVVSSTTGVVTVAEARVALVDEQEMTVAVTEVPMALLTPGHPQPLAVDLPAGMPPKGVRPEVTLAVDRTLADARLIAALPATAHGTGETTRVAVEWTNTGTQPAGRLLLLITALDEQDVPLRRWTAQWPRAVAPGDAVRFEIATPIEADLPVARWTVDAAAP